MEFNKTRKQLLNIITDEYLHKYRSKTLSDGNFSNISKQDIQISTTTCDNNCSKCIELYMDINESKNSNVTLIEHLRDTTCRYLCECNTEIRMNMDSTLLTNETPVKFEDKDVSDIVSNITNKYRKDFPSISLPNDEKTFEELLKNKDEITNTIHEEISQISANVQFSNNEGGNIRKTSMDMVSTIVMNAIISQTDNETKINNMVIESVSEMHKFVDKKFDNLFTRIWKTNECFFIIMISVIVVSFLFTIIMKFKKTLKLK